MSRLQYWRDRPWRLGAVHSHEDENDPLQQAWRARVEHPKKPREGDNGFSTGYLTRISKEIVFCLDEANDNCPTLLYVTWGLDLATAELVLAANWMQVRPSRDELLTGLGLALAYHVPVVPDVDELAPQLEALERELLTTGFLLEGDEGKQRLINSRYARVDVDEVDALKLLQRCEPVMPSEVRVLVSTAQRELGARAEAGRVLAAVRLAIAELSTALEAAEANEADLQQCLTRHPILFGTEYSRLVPEFRLGGDYRMDFALVRSSGLADLVEIEASTHSVFNRRGDPSAALVHAEQQVLNWLGWLDRFGELARRDLPEIQRPVGYVVIGRENQWTDHDRHRLEQRNLILGSALQVMTWDGLLRRAQILLRHLEGLGRLAEEAET